MENIKVYLYLYNKQINNFNKSLDEIVNYINMENIKVYLYLYNKQINNINKSLNEIISNINNQQTKNIYIKNKSHKNGLIIL